MTKILILNAGSTNKGNRALVHSTIETIKNFVPDAEFNLMGPYAVDNYDLKVEIQAGVISKKPQHTAVSLLYLLKCSYINLFKRFGMNTSISKNSRLFKYYDCDMVINSGGDHMSGEYGILTLGTFVNILYAILLGKPVVLYADSLGYYHNGILDSIAKFIFNRTRLILLREKLSKKWLDEKDINNPKIYVTADPAFLLDPAPQSHVFEILSKEGINEIQKPIIGINPSGLITRYAKGNGQEGKERTNSILAKVIDNLIENLNTSIIMIPHVYTPRADDRVAIDQIFREVKNKSKVKMIKNEYTPQELKGIIGLCDLFIGARMHATIAATSMFVPTVGIAYSHKMYGIIGEMLGQERYIVDIKELGYDSLISKINDAWKNREEIKKELDVKIPEMKKKAMLNGKLVKELFDSLKTS